MLSIAGFSDGNQNATALMVASEYPASELLTAALKFLLFFRHLCLVDSYLLHKFVSQCFDDQITLNGKIF
jgi:hypothetical protein